MIDKTSAVLYRTVRSSFRYTSAPTQLTIAVLESGTVKKSSSTTVQYSPIPPTHITDSRWINEKIISHLTVQESARYFLDGVRRGKAELGSWFRLQSRCTLPTAAGASTTVTPAVRYIGEQSWYSAVLQRRQSSFLYSGKKSEDGGGER